MTCVAGRRPEVDRLGTPGCKEPTFDSMYVAAPAPTSVSQVGRATGFYQRL
jgi:hypothetical protein